MSTMKRAVSVIELHFQYAQDGWIMSDDTYGERDADSAVAFTRDGCAFVACERAPRGRWRIDSTDGSPGPVPLSAYRYRFSNLADAATYVAKKHGATVHRVDSWI
ncbi:hypothetical protein [Lentzea sp. NBRC 105346]|uniref:hypothetical protein n=1 Tax=Lentzea sp. NBRC 105346 TaxID=3032205 RepID=UPI0025538AC6|nr:hypothetical protein [Lentzea sp. NBRC 105346]